MADRDHDGAERDTDGFLYTDLSDNSSVCGLDPLPLKLDHCDLLLDAMDAQLGQLQVQPQKREATSRVQDGTSAAPLRWNESLSKDTGLGSTSPTNDTPMSCLDLIHTPTTGQTSEDTTGCWEGPATHQETKKRLDRRTKSREEAESRREQVIWRLERLLGDTCKEGKIAGETHPPSDSICTEDFVRRFREEMVELALPDSSTQQRDKEEEAERTEISDSDTGRSEKNGQSVLSVERRGSAATTGESNADVVTAQCSQSNKPASRGAGVVADCENTQHNNSCSPKARCLAGVPVWSFDTVSIDSDLNTVCSEQVRRHIHKSPGWRSLIESVTDMNVHHSNQSDYDTATQEESEPQPTSVQRSSSGQNRRSKRETYRHVCSWSDNDKDTDEEVNPRSRRSRPEKISEKMQSDWTKMKERLSNLRLKCEREEQTLRLKRTQLKDVELCLSELRQKRKHALQELERLTADTAQMKTEKRTLESVLRQSRVEKESISCQLQKLQREKESCLLEVRDIKALAALSLCKQTLKDGAGMKTNIVVTSALEREEMEKQLDSTKTEMFSEQRRAREKLESVQEKLEETREELMRATEAESSLRARCASLEEKQMQKKEQIEVLEVQVSELQEELGECKIRVGTLEKMLAQKELKLIDLQEQYGTLQAEKDGLKGELQQLKSQNYKALKEAQEQTQRMKVNMQAEEEKATTLKEQTRSLTQHIESMKGSIQLKEEEVIKLRKCLQQQKEEAKKRAEALHVEALERVHKAVEEERKKWEAEKVEAVQVHCGIIEEQNRKALESLRSEMHRERSKALALQNQVVELKTRVQELESESCAQQREQESVLAVICKSLKEEHQAELQRSQKHMEQQSQRTVLRLKQDVQLAERQTDRLRVMLEERESGHKQITAEMDQQLGHWAQQLGAECQHLHLLVEQSGAKQSARELSPSRTVAEALTTLRTLREQLKLFITHLHQQLDSQKCTNEQLRKDKERELSIQRQQLRVERDQALDSIKERLIQEHIEELSNLKWAHMSDGGGEGGGVAASLRKQLKAKDLELRQVQRSMSQWREQTAARLACKFEEELTAELERKTSKTREEKQRKPERPEGEMMLAAKETLNSVCSPFDHTVDSAASYSPTNMASFKLLRYLQSRVKQLRVENQAHTWSPSSPDATAVDLSGSYLTAITQTQTSAGILSLTSVSSEGHEALHCVSGCTPVI